MPPDDLPAPPVASRSDPLSLDDCMRVAETARQTAILLGTPASVAQSTYELAALSCHILSPASACEGERQCRSVAKLRLEVQLAAGKSVAELSAEIDAELAFCRSICDGQGVDLEACAARVPVRNDLPPKEREVAYQTDIARYCSAPGVSNAQARLIARANVDYSAAAAQMVTGARSPAQYLALSRDRTRKLRAAEDNPITATLLYTSPDSDGDWVVDLLDPEHPGPHGHR